MENHSLGGAKAPPNPDHVPKSTIDIVDLLTPKQLMNLRHHLDMVLKIEIGQLNLTEELGLQYRQGKELLAAIQGDDRVPANQKAQVFNSVQSQLEKIVKMRALVFSQERMKRLEGAILKTIEMQPTDAEKIVFMDLYAGYLKDRGQ